MSDACMQVCGALGRGLSERQVFTPARVGPQELGMPDLASRVDTAARGRLDLDAAAGWSGLARPGGAGDAVNAGLIAEDTRRAVTAHRRQFG